MGIKNTINGVFLSCLGYNPKHEERFKSTINLISLNDFYKSEKPYLNLINQCHICHMKMDSYFISSKLKLHICVNNPSCAGYKLEKGFLTFLFICLK